MPKYGCRIDLAGRKFSRLTVIRYVGKTSRRQSLWLCRCVCGAEKKIAYPDLTRKNNSTKSCGCLRAERIGKLNFKHGGKRQHAHEYVVWGKMLSRCYATTDTCYHRYGGRGIKVCRKWRKNFAAFLVDMGNRPDASLTLERKNNSLGYSPENCCWASQKQQARNRRSNRKITFKGQTKILIEWAEELGVNYKTLHNRIVGQKWPIKKSFEYGSQRGAEQPRETHG